MFSQDFKDFVELLIKKEVEIADFTVNFIGYHDLLKNKKETGRLKDLDDIENLQ